MTETGHVLEEWELTPDGASYAGHAQPVRTREGRPAVLKVGEPDTIEHLALTRWDGDGAVRLLRADPHRGALLLERATGPDLSEAWDIEACERIGELYARLHRPIGAPFPRLSTWASALVETLATVPRGGPVPHRLVEQAVSVARTFATDEATDGVLVHGDLHYGHVVESERGLLAIAPVPFSGTPLFEVAPLLWTRFDELAGDVRNGLRRRFHAAIDAAGFDEEQARDWVVVRAVERASRAVDPEDLTRCIAVVKAVQD
ncbi:aminoglycoside phosphotransferase family protein [Nocardioides marmorisolisilvae]|uniref:aminoglycoside phosphotransferase family protein n=1 Tax=Nocardioides marmorisolisilvae TaxID=1542737 RepID=UPI00161A7E5E|nr:aminoglycoside phosphotransferase family protein [Nocardioides marmorisolisilvae]